MGRRRGKKQQNSVDADIDKEFEGLMAFEEIPNSKLVDYRKETSDDENYEVLYDVKENGKQKKMGKGKKMKNGSVEEEDEEEAGNKKNKKGKKKKMNNKQNGKAIAEHSNQNLNGKNKPNKRKANENTNGKAKKARYDKATYHGSSTSEQKKKVDVNAWRSIFVPEPVVKAITKLGFSKPTEIQQLSIPPAIKGRKDIIGAAETGSGKTLAFGIPIIHGILLDKKRESDGNDSDLESSGDEEGMEYGDDEEEQGDVTEEEANGMGDDEDDFSSDEDDDLEVLDATSFDFTGNDMEGKEEDDLETQDIISDSEEGEEEEGDSEDEGENDEEVGEGLEASFNGFGGIEEIDEIDELEETEENDLSENENNEFDEDENNFEDEELENDEGFETEPENLNCVRVIKNVKFDFDCPPKGSSKRRKKLRALILTPTRELAVQVNGHLLALLGNTNIKTAVVVGGMSSEKQERQLARCPEIVIGTPGRLWEMVKTGNEHLNQIPYIRYLAIDETDRMVEKGHFQEMSDLLDLMNSDPKCKEKRQTFVFSATLTMIHMAPKRLKFKKKAVPMTEQGKIDKLVKMIGIKKGHKVVDVTQKFGTAESLTESKIICDLDEKDFYLYYFLKQYPGRTLVFCNSIDCVRRLQNVFNILECHPQPLHASMQQRQRLKNLEKFSANPKGLLVATDVAARGLDIPNIQHVIHYQVPRTAETYVHRSGRTARAMKEGLSVLFIAPGEINRYHIMCKTLNRDTELPPFPLDTSTMAQVKERVNMARELEQKEHAAKKKTNQDSWINKMAKEAMMDSDSDEYDDDWDREVKTEISRKKKELQILRAKMTQLLRKPLMTYDFSSKFPTQTGSLINPFRDEEVLEKAGQKESKDNKAVKVIKKETKNYSNFVKNVKIKPPSRRPYKDKKNKGFEKKKKKREEEKRLYLKQKEKEKMERENEMY